MIRYNSDWRANKELVGIHNDAAHQELVEIYNKKEASLYVVYATNPSQMSRGPHHYDKTSKIKTIKICSVIAVCCEAIDHTPCLFNLNTKSRKIKATKLKKYKKYSECI